jgi:hypothetical protein
MHKTPIFFIVIPKPPHAALTTVFTPLDGIDQPIAIEGRYELIAMRR